MHENIRIEIEEFNAVMKRFRSIFLLLNVLTIVLVLYLLGKALSLTIITRFDILGIVLITMACVVICLVQLYYMRSTGAESRRRLHKLSIIDPLTNTYNHNYIEGCLRAEVRRCMRYKRGTAIIYFRVGGFKMLNDLYGRDAGDRVLVQLADLLKSTLRATDVVGRLVGGEFLAILPEASIVDAEISRKRIKEIVEIYDFRTAQGKKVGKVTCCTGIAAFPDSAKSAKELVVVASQAASHEEESEEDRIVI